MINSVLKPKSVLKKSQMLKGGTEYSKPQDSDNHYTASSSMVNSFYFKLNMEPEISEIIETLKDKPYQILNLPS